MAKINRSSSGITHLIKSVLTEITERAASGSGGVKNGKLCLSHPRDEMIELGFLKHAFDQTIQIHLRGNLCHRYHAEAEKFLIAVRFSTNVIACVHMS